MQRIVTMLALTFLVSVALAVSGTPPTPIPVQPGAQAPVDLQQLKKTDPARYVATMQAIEHSQPQGQKDLSGGPDADGYLWKDSDESGGPTYSWDNNYSTYSYGDDTYWTFSFGWNFFYRGTNYSTVYINSNGSICFSSGTTAYNQATFPSTSILAQTVGPWCLDMYSNATYPIRWGTYGTTPNRKVVVTYDGCPTYSYGGNYYYQVILAEADSSITFQYGTGTAWTSYGYIGMQGLQTVGLNIPRANLKNNYAIKFRMLTGTPGLWTGNVSTDWNNSGNWDFPAVPDSTKRVVIPAGRPNYPTTNNGAGYGAKRVFIASGASMTVVASKALACMDTLSNAGTLTNNGTIRCGGHFINTGDFASGSGSNFYFNKSAAATATTGATDATCQFFNVYVAKVPLSVQIGVGFNTMQTYWFGGSPMTMIDPAGPATMASDVTGWSCWDNYNLGGDQGQIKIYRANYGGYQYGLVGQGSLQNLSYGTNTFTETVTGVQVGDLVGLFQTGTTFGSSGAGFYYTNGNVGNYTGWSNFYGWGPLGFYAMQSAPAGAVTTVGSVDINGGLNIATGDSLKNASDPYFVAGDWTNNGAYAEGTGPITFDGTTTISGTGPARFNTVNVTGALTAPALLTVKGDWNCTGTFNHNDGEVDIINGTSIGGGGAAGAFYDLYVSSLLDGDVTLTGNLNVDNYLDAEDGRFVVGANTLTLGTADASGMCDVFDRFSVVGSALDASGTVTAAAAAFPYTFKVQTDAAIAARYANFTWMDAEGVQVMDGAAIDATDNFSQCTFTAGDEVGAMLDVENDQVIADISNLSFVGTAGYNIDYVDGTGHLTITAGSGARWGEDFDNDPSNLVDWRGGDIGPTVIVAPIGSYDTSATIAPKVKVKNFTGLPALGAKIVFRIDSTGGSVTLYADTLTRDINPSAESTFTFKPWAAINVPGTYASFCSTYVAGDTKPSNDVIRGTFVLSSAPPGWYAKKDMPAGAKPVKDGGWLTYDASKARIYATRGQKQPDFWAYAPAGDSWGLRAPWQPGVEGKLPKTGSDGCADGNGIIYATKGNNTSGFYKYNANTNTWTARANVPLGLSNKKVKGGTGLVYAFKGSVGSPYLLKGYKNEFYKYNDSTDAWTTLAPAPGGIPKWDKGSWLAYDDVNKKIYAFKAKYMEFYSYDTEKDSWSAALAPMPLAGSTGSKKAKAGGSGAFIGGSIYALKGGNTQQFFKYTIATNAWAEKETLPKGLLKKKVNAGGDIVTAGLTLYALKGNKTNELWQYVPGGGLMALPEPGREGVLAGKTAIAQGVSISPNPLASGFAVLRYSLPKAGTAQLSVYNVAGQTVVSQTLVAGRSGAVNLDLRHLSNGVYLAKFSSEGFVSSQKLVVQR